MQTSEVDLTNSLCLLNEFAPRYLIGSMIHRNNAGRVLSFDDKPWLRDLYFDNSRNIVVVKSSQCGLTEWALVDVFTLASRGIAGLYVLPTDDMRSTFVPNRIDLVMDRVPGYGKRVTGRGVHKTDQIGMKTIFNVNWKIVGSRSRKNFFEFPAGCIMIDEFDLCEQGNLQWAYDRLGAAEGGGYIRKIGNPTLQGFGIDHAFDNSDGKEWFVKCHCGHAQTLGWHTHFVGDESEPQLRHKTGRPICEKCHKTFDRLGVGEWVAARPEKVSKGEAVPVSGYHISKLFADRRRLPIIRILHLKYVQALNNPLALQNFYNSDLGIPFGGSGTQIDWDILAGCVADYTPLKSGAGMFFGVDVGRILHVHIQEVLPSGIVRKHVIETVRDWDELHKLTERFGYVCGVVDALPETHAAEKFVKAHRGWLLAYYKTQPSGRFKIVHKDLTINIGRTVLLDITYNAWCNRMIEIPGTWKSIDNGNFVKQMMAPVRRFDEKANRGLGGFVWDEGDKDDHHRHADAYAHLACMASGFSTGDFAGGWVD